MKTVSIDDELAARGLPLEPCSAPRFGVNLRWLLVLLVVFVGFVALGVRARALGRQGTLPTFVLVTVVFVAFVVGAHVRRVRVLLSLSQPDYQLIGWTLTWFHNADVLRRMAAGAGGRQATTAVVGVFLTPSGITLRLHLPQDPNVPLTSESEAALGYRGRARWVLVGPPTDRVALRLHRLGTSSTPSERVP